MSYPIDSVDNNEFVPTSNSQLDIKKFFFKLVGFFPWIILSILISYTIGRIYLRYTPQVHKVASYVLIKDEGQNNSDNKILEDLGVMPDSKEVQNQIDIFQSYSLLNGIIDSVNLEIQLIDEGRIASTSLYGSKLPIIITPVKSDTSRFTPSSYKLLLYQTKFSIIENGKPVFHNYNDTFTLANRKVSTARNYNIKIDPKGYILAIKNYHELAMKPEKLN